MIPASRIRSRITNGIQRAGVRTGNGSPMVGRITKKPILNESVYPPTQIPNPVPPFDVSFFLTNYSMRDIAAGLVQAGDMSMMIAPFESMTASSIENGDILVVTSTELNATGKKFRLSNVEAFMPGGMVLYVEATGTEVKG